MELYALLLPILVIGGLALPRPAIAFTFGLLLPIDVIGSIDPMLLDVARYGLVAILVGRSLENGVRTEKLSPPALAAVLCLLAAFGVGLLKLAVTIGQDNFSPVPVVGLISVIFAVYVAKDVAMRRPILLGFTLGAFASAVDIHLQVLGLPFLGTPSAWGTRYAGLTFSSTNTAPFLALALILTIMPSVWNRSDKARSSSAASVLRIVLALSLGSGLLLSGGRGGFLGFTVAMLLLALSSVRTNHLLTVFFTFSVPVAVLIFWEDIVDYISRDGQTLDITSGRSERNAEAWSVLSQNWASGIPYESATALNPHTPVLLFGLQFGVIGFLLVIVVTSVVLYAALCGIGKTGVPLTASMMAAVMFVTALLEPLGFYVGLAKTTLLLLVLTAVSGGGRIDADISKGCPTRSLPSVST